jgi:hypothetical protein
VAQVTSPEDFSNFCHPHWRTRMAGIGLLHGIHGQCANGAGQGRKLGEVADAHDPEFQPAEKLKLSGKRPVLGRAKLLSGR